MYYFENVTSTMYNSWNLSAEEYLNDYLPSYNALMVLETDPND